MRQCSLILFLLLSIGVSRPVKAQAIDSSGHRLWRQRLVPYHTKLQFAGSIGWLSASVGYRFWKQKAEIDISADYVPRRYNGNTQGLFTAAAKFTALPWQLSVTSRTTAYPLSFGMWLSITPAKNLELFWPDYYPTLYYWAPTAVRGGVFLGGRLEQGLRPGARLRSVAAYYELGTNDLLLASWFHNRSTVRVGSLLHLALGVQLRLRQAR